MNIWLAVAILIGANALAAGVMLVVRRRAPSGSYFEDTQQAAGVFAVAGTTFAVLVAFTFLVAYQSYNNARSSAEDEATAVQTLFHTAEFFPPAERDALQEDLVCYARAVIHSEWPLMRYNRTSHLVNHWGSRAERHFEQIRATTGEAQGAAVQNWFEQTDDRQTARRGRLSQAAPLVPPLIWLFLITGGTLVVAFVLYFADRRERRLSQAGLIVAVTTFVVTSLVMVHFLDTPYEGQSGSIEPTAMRETLSLIKGEAAGRRALAAAPCNNGGRPRIGA